MAMPLLKFLDQRAIPHMVFINKIETAQVGLRELMESLQGPSPTARWPCARCPSARTAR